MHTQAHETSEEAAARHPRQMLANGKHTHLHIPILERQMLANGKRTQYYIARLKRLPSRSESHCCNDNAQTEMSDSAHRLRRLLLQRKHTHVRLHFSGLSIAFAMTAHKFAEALCCLTRRHTSVYIGKTCCTSVCNNTMHKLGIQAMIALLH